MTTMAGDTELVEVRLVGLPIDIQARAEEHSEELMREFSHIAHSDSEVSQRIPERLLDLVARLRAQYGPLTEPVRETIDTARLHGRAVIDVSYHVPPDVAEAVDQLAAELDEADMFCRSGDLLTLATPPELLEFRRWFLGEFKRQVAGEPPTPWKDYLRG